VWITPCGTRPDKPSLRTPSLHRLIMCHLAVDTTFGSRFGVKVCDEEMQAPRNIPTIVLMRRLKTRYPNYEFSFVVGSDLIPTLHEWEASGCAPHAPMEQGSEGLSVERENWGRMRSPRGACSLESHVCSRDDVRAA
jgi:hypothetical protein